MSVNKRLKDLENATGTAQEAPPYICVDDLADLEGLDCPWPVKVYVGFSPDDWDDPQEVKE